MGTSFFDFINQMAADQSGSPWANVPLDPGQPDVGHTHPELAGTPALELVPNWSPYLTTPYAFDPTGRARDPLQQGLAPRTPKGDDTAQSRRMPVDRNPPAWFGDTLQPATTSPWAPGAGDEKTQGPSWFGDTLQPATTPPWRPPAGDEAPTLNIFGDPGRASTSDLAAQQATTAAATPTATATAAPPSGGGGGGGFWGGLLEVLKNVPLQGGGLRQQWQLPSYNQMTAGKRTLEWAKGQGLDVGPIESVSPQEAQLRVQEAAKQPMGMVRAERLVPLEKDEPPERTMQRQWIAQLPQSAVTPMVQEYVKQYGLPGVTSGRLQLPTGLYPSDTDTIPQPPAATTPPSIQQAPTPTAPPAAPPAGAGAPAPALPQPGARPQAPSTTPLAQASPRQEAPTAPTAQAMPQPQARAQGLQMPQEPQPPSMRVTEQDAQRDPEVATARQVYNTPGLTRQQQLAAYTEYDKAYRSAEQRIQKQRRDQFATDRQVHALAMQNWAKQVDVAHANLQNIDKDVREQLYMEYAQTHGGQNPPVDWMPTPQEVTDARPRAAQRLAQEAAVKTAAETQARMGAEFGVEKGLPLWKTDAQTADHYLNPVTLTPIDSNTPKGVAEAARQSGQVVKPSTPQVEFINKTRTSVVPIIDKMAWYIDKIYGDGGIFANMSPSERANVLKNGWQSFTQDNPFLTEARGYFARNRVLLSRMLEEAKGNTAARLVDAVTEGIPNLDAAFSFSGKAPFVHMEMPDTRGAAIRTMQSLMDQVDQMMGSAAGSPTFKNNWQQRWQTPEQQPGVRPGRTELSPQMPSGYEDVTQGQRGEKRLRQKKEFWLGREEPATPAFPGAPMPQPRQQEAPAPSMSHLREQVQTIMGIKQPPNPQQDPYQFQIFMGKVREQLDKAYPKMSKAEKDARTAEIARQGGGSWQPQP